MVFAEKGFGGSETDNARKSVSEAREAFIVRQAFGFVDEIAGKHASFVGGAFGAGVGSKIFVDGGIFAIPGVFNRRNDIGLAEGAIADGEYMLSGGLEKFVDH